MESHPLLLIRSGRRGGGWACVLLTDLEDGRRHQSCVEYRVGVDLRAAY